MCIRDRQSILRADPHSNSPSHYLDLGVACAFAIYPHRGVLPEHGRQTRRPSQGTEQVVLSAVQFLLDPFVDLNLVRAVSSQVPKTFRIGRRNGCVNRRGALLHYPEVLEMAPH